MARLPAGTEANVQAKVWLCENALAPLVRVHPVWVSVTPPSTAMAKPVSKSVEPVIVQPAPAAAEQMVLLGVTCFAERVPMAGPLAPHGSAVTVKVCVFDWPVDSVETSCSV